MKSVQVVEAKAKFSALLTAVEAGETVAITRHGRVIARMVPEVTHMASDLFAPMWEAADEIDLTVPKDQAPEPIGPL
jgi:prevent-host-death family protein